MKKSFSNIAAGLLTACLFASCNDRGGEMVGLNEDENPTPGRAQKEDEQGKSGESTAKDEDKELLLAQSNAQSGRAEDQYELAKVYARRVKEGKEAMDKVVEWTRKAAEQGHEEAMITLAGMYYTGTEIKRDAREARIWFEKAAEKGSREAQVFLGRIYLTGDGIATDFKKGWEHVRKAADDNLPAAKGILGRAVWEGLYGMEQQKDKGIELMEQAAYRGDTPSAMLLGKIYYNGMGTEKDVAKSFEWYNRAARQGEPEAQYIAAMMLLQGEGVAKNEQEAVSLLKLAAGQDHVSAMTLLAACYKTGTGTDYDPEIGRVWEERARKLDAVRQENTGTGKNSP